MKNYRLRQVVWTMVSLLFVIAPISSLIIYKRDEWFSSGGGVKLGVGFIAAAVFIALVLYGALKNIHASIAKIIWLGALLLITNLLNAILQDLFVILLCAIIGYLFFIPFDMLAKINGRKANAMLDEKIVQEVRNNGRA